MGEIPLSRDLSETDPFYFKGAVLSCNLKDRTRLRSSEGTLVKGASASGLQFSMPLGTKILKPEDILTKLPLNEYGPYGYSEEMIADQIIDKNAYRIPPNVLQTLTYCERFDLINEMRKRKKECYKLYQRPYFKNVFRTQRSIGIATQPSLGYMTSLPYDKPAEGITKFAAVAHFGPDTARLRHAFDLLEDPARNLLYGYAATESDLASAFSRMRPENWNELAPFNLGEFLFELKSVRQLLNMGNFNRLANLHEVATVTAENNLGYNFGVSPFVSDLKKIVNATDNIAAFIKKWNEFAAKGQVIDLHATMFSHSDLPPADVEYTHNALGPVEFTVQPEVTCIAKAHMYIRPKPLPSNAYSKLLLTYTGLDKPHLVVWELLPWSWFIDYFLDIQGFIDSFGGLDSPFEYDVVDAGYSVSEESTTVITITQEVELSGQYVIRGPAPRPWACVGTNKLYHRIKVPPSLAQTLSEHPPGWDLQLGAPGAKQTSFSLSALWLTLK